MSKDEVGIRKKTNRYKRQEVAPALPAIPPWPEQIRETGKELLSSWIKQEEFEASAKKRELTPAQYRRYCETKIKENEEAKAKDWLQLPSTDSNLLFQLLYQAKIDLYAREKPKKANRRETHIEIVKSILKENPNINRRDLTKQTVARARQLIDPGKERSFDRLDAKQVRRIIDQYFPRT